MGVSKLLGQLLSRSPKGVDSAETNEPPATPLQQDSVKDVVSSPRHGELSDTSGRESPNSPRRSHSSVASTERDRRHRRAGERTVEQYRDRGARRFSETERRRSGIDDLQRMRNSPTFERRRRGSDSKEAERRKVALQSPPRRKHSLQEEMSRVRKISIGGGCSTGKKSGHMTGSMRSTRSGTLELARPGRALSTPRGRGGVRSDGAMGDVNTSARQGKSSSLGKTKKRDDEEAKRETREKKRFNERLRRSSKREHSIGFGSMPSSSTSSQSPTDIDGRADLTGSDTCSSRLYMEDEIPTVTSEELFQDEEPAGKIDIEPAARVFRNLDNGRPEPLFRNNRQRLEKLRKRKFMPKSSLDKIRPPPLKLSAHLNRSLGRIPETLATSHQRAAVIGSGIVPMEKKDSPDDSQFLEERDDEDVGSTFDLSSTVPTLNRDALSPLREAVIRPAQRSPNREMSENQFVFGGGPSLGDTGFVIQDNGMMQAPQHLSRKNSDGSSVEGVPKSTHRVVTVESLNDFRRGPNLGAGYAGCVYLAVHEPTGLKMAVKEVNVINTEKRKQLLKELETLTTHVSRFLVRFYGAFFDRTGAVRIALEYMDRGSLCRAIKKLGPVPEPVVNRIAAHCLHGLLFLHNNHVLHRDLKTANILLSRRLKRAKLSDFGLAREVNPGVSKANTFVGTLAYMSPERLEGGEYTYASDIWGLGISLVESILGRYPFENPQTFFDFLEAVKTNPHTLIGSNCSDELVDFVKVCTYTDPKKRPTAHELLQHPWIVESERDEKAFEEWLGRIPEFENVRVEGRETDSWG